MNSTHPASTLSDSTASATPAGYFRVPVSSLRVDAVANFELYIQPRPDAVPVLYRARDLAFTEEARQRLIDHSVGALFVPTGQRAEYRHYVEKNLTAIVSDEDIPVEERSDLLYDSAQNIVHDILEDPRSGDVLPPSENLVQGTIDFLFKEGRSFHCLMQVTSYDYYTYTHSVNVFVFSTALAQKLGIEGQELFEFGQGALLHDVGKSLVPNEVVNAKGGLTEEQWAEMKLHPVHGYNILKEQGVESEIILDVTRHHHEKLNGRGYPDGLAGDAVSKWARICTIADIFDALTTRRSYKEAMNSFPGLQFMREHMEDEIDPEFFRVFVGLMGSTAG